MSGDHDGHHDEKVKPEQAPHSDFLKEHGLPESKYMKYKTPESSDFSMWATRTLDKLVFAVPRYIREEWIRPNQKDYPYYHRQYRRVPTIDECYTTDYVCQFEADEQFYRDRLVESNIITILAGRLNDCSVHYTNTRNRFTVPEEDPCHKLKEDYTKACLNFYVKYGDLTFYSKSTDVLMKQKHRLIWERRNGEYTMEAQEARRGEDLAKGFWEKGQ